MGDPIAMTGLPRRAPRIAIITPTKDRLPLLRETIASVAAQTLTEWEHLIVDDGSVDGTVEEATRLAAADPRVRYVARTTGASGASACRNLGIAESRADLLVFLDSDDLLEPEALERRVRALEQNCDLDFVTFQTGVFLKTPGDLGRELDPQRLGDDLLRFLFLECPWQTTAPTWRRTAIERLGGFDESLPSWQDVDLHIRALCAGMKYLRCDGVDHHFRWQFEPTKVSVEQRRSPRHLQAGLTTLEKFESVIRSGPGMTWSRQRALCSLYFFVAEHWVMAGHPLEALKAWRLVRRRKLGPPWLHLPGAALLLVKGLGAPGDWIGQRLINRWKGLMRLRSEPGLVKP